MKGVLEKKTRSRSTAELIQFSQKPSIISQSKLNQVEARTLCRPRANTYKSIWWNSFRKIMSFHSFRFRNRYQLRSVSVRAIIVSTTIVQDRIKQRGRFFWLPSIFVYDCWIFHSLFYSSPPLSSANMADSIYAFPICLCVLFRALRFHSRVTIFFLLRNKQSHWSLALSSERVLESCHYLSKLKAIVLLVHCSYYILLPLLFLFFLSIRPVAFEHRQRGAQIDSIKNIWAAFILLSAEICAFITVICSCLFICCCTCLFELQCSCRLLNSTCSETKGIQTDEVIIEYSHAPLYPRLFVTGKQMIHIIWAKRYENVLFT